MAPAGELLIECRGLACGYETGAVLEDVDLAVHRGEIVAIMGVSGCGKSTLLRTMLGLLRPLAGRVYLFGEDLYAASADRRAELLRRTGTVFQRDALFASLTVHDNIALPLREVAHLPEPIVREMVRIKLALVGMSGSEALLPANLSGGQQKRIALARAAALDPEIVLCDEPTAALDPIVAAGIDAALLHLRDVLGVTIVAVSHDVASVGRVADRAALLNSGRILALGTVAELAASGDPDVREFFHQRAMPASGVSS